MSLYQQKLNKVKNSLINLVKEQIVRKHVLNEFNTWGYSTITYSYVSSFKEEFSNYMNDAIEARIDLAGHHAGFAIDAFVQTKPNYSLNDLLNFVESFMARQLDDINNWCDDISRAMHNQEEFRNNEDNPS